MFLQSGQAGVLVETVDGSYAVLVTSTTGKATVVQETKSGGRTKLPLSALKDIEGVAALAVGGDTGTEATHGVDVMKQVRGSVTAPNTIYHHDWFVSCSIGHTLLCALQQ